MSKVRCTVEETKFIKSQNERFSSRFLFQFCSDEAYFVENHCHPWSLKEKIGLPLNSRWEVNFV